VRGQEGRGDEERVFRGVGERAEARRDARIVCWGRAAGTETERSRGLGDWSRVSCVRSTSRELAGVAGSWRPRTSESATSCGACYTATLETGRTERRAAEETNNGGCRASGQGGGDGSTRARNKDRAGAAAAGVGAGSREREGGIRSGRSWCWRRSRYWWTAARCWWFAACSGMAWPER
jgi:hypothetical protein